MPTLNDTLHRLSKAKLFSVLDVRGFYQMTLHQDSRDYTTFWIPVGRYQYCRVSWGIASAPDENQRRLVQAYDCLKNVAVVADDTIVWRETLPEAIEDHHQIMQALFEQARTVGLCYKKNSDWA